MIAIPRDLLLDIEYYQSIYATAINDSKMLLKLSKSTKEYFYPCIKKRIIDSNYSKLNTLTKYIRLAIQYV